MSLTSNIYRRSAPTSEHPSILVTTTLIAPPILTLALRGEFDSGTILEADFRAEHFDFYDLTTSLPVVHSQFLGTCDPGNDLYSYDVVQLNSSKDLVTWRLLEDVSPLSDPVRQLKAGHEYRLTLKPQRIWCYCGTVAELFGEREHIPRSEPPEEMIVISSDDELVLKVEA